MRFVPFVTFLVWGAATTDTTDAFVTTTRLSGHVPALVGPCRTVSTHRSATLSVTGDSGANGESGTSSQTSSSSTSSSSVPVKEIKKKKTLKELRAEGGPLTFNTPIGALNPFAIYYGLLSLALGLPWYVVLKSCQLLYFVTRGRVDPKVCTCQSFSLFCVAGDHCLRMVSQSSWRCLFQCSFHSVVSPSSSVTYGGYSFCDSVGPTPKW